jgi:prepilin-type processing-associated H-X9-DG protein
MAISFSCPLCGAPQSAEERFAGLTGPCTACGKMLTVPQAAGGFAPNTGAYTPGKPSGGGAGKVLLIIGVVALVVIVGCGGVMAALLIPAVGAARTAARRMQSINNEKQIMLALMNYESVNRSFPPAYVADENGKPMTSWRVLILPYLEQQHLYSQYDFNQPWDSPQNMAVANTMPPQYRSPLEPNPAKNTNHTSYMLFAGKDSAFNDPKKPPSFAQLVDGSSNTMALAEVNNSGVIWTQPTDLDTAQLDFMIRDMKNAQPGQLNTAQPMGINVGFFDGSVRTLSKNVSPEELRKAADPDDGQAVNLDGF